MRSWPIVLVALVLGLPVAPAVVGDLLPALSPSAHALSDHDLVRDPTTGAILLRFTNEIDNGGAGPLVITATRERSNEPITTLPAVQRILQGDGSWREVPAGSIVWHPEHHHFHWAGAARYVLRDEATGAAVATSDKVSFCLADVATLSPAPAGTPTAPVYNSCEHDTRATDVTMGISVGWGDVYDRRLVGQAFDVSALMQRAPRWYVLESTTDPGSILMQSNGPTTASARVWIGEGVPVGVGTSRPGV